jgi:hypothetical protein
LLKRNSPRETPDLKIKKMDTGNILIGVISIIAIVLPFIIMYRKSKSTERGLIKNLKEYANKNNFQLDKWESVGNLALGIDNVNQLAYFVEVEGVSYETRHIALSEISICKVDREVRDVDYHGERDKVTHSLNICFYPKNKRDEIICFRLFDEDNNRMLSGEIQLANDWVSNYNEVINSTNASSTVAFEHKIAVG